MRILFYSLIGLPLLAADLVLLVALPSQLSAMTTRRDGWILAGGAVAYVIFHFLVRKPERMYLWAHEFAHLITAKLFFRKVHGFHITSRTGGRVVIDRTNVVIDLAPYLVPPYSLAAGGIALLLRSASPWIPEIYLLAASFLFTMHLFFSVEGFVRGQPDVTRSGRVFSAAVVLLSLMLWIPFLLAPGSGWKGVAAAYRGWFFTGERIAGRLFLDPWSLFRF
jgi:hypothetical protein